MAPRRTLAAYGIVTYRVRLALTAWEWGQLKREAEAKGVTGTQLIEIILNDVCKALPAPAAELPEDDSPPPDYEDMVQVE